MAEPSKVGDRRRTETESVEYEHAGARVIGTEGKNSNEVISGLRVF